MNRITGRSAFLALLKDEGITHLFGNPGTTELPIMHALKEHPGSHLCAGVAGGAGGGDGRRLLARQRQAGRVQRACGAGARQCHGLAVQCQVHGHADDPDRRPAGAGPRPHRAAAVSPAGADGRAAGEVGRGGDAAGGPAAHRAPRRQGGDDAADGAGVHFAAGRHPQCRGRYRAGRLHPRRHAYAAERRRARCARQADAAGRAAGDHRRRRDREKRCAGGRGRVRRDAGRARLSAERALRVAFPLRARLLRGLAVARPEAGARPARQARPADRARAPTRCACRCGARWKRSPTTCRCSTSARSTGTWARTSRPRWPCGPMCARRCWR